MPTSSCDNTLALGRHPPDQRHHGPCAGGDVYSPAITDFIFMVKDTCLHVRDRPRCGEDRHPRGPSAAEDLGGARLHARKSRRLPTSPSRTTSRRSPRSAALVDFLPPQQPRGAAGPRAVRRRATASSPSLDTLVPDEPNKPYDMKELVRKVVDEGDFFEISPTSRKNILVGFGRMDGRTVGIVANQPHGAWPACWTSTPAAKAARFVRFCDALQHPARHLRGRAGLHAGHRSRSTAASSSTGQAAVRLRRGDRAEDHRRSPARPTAAPMT